MRVNFSHRFRTVRDTSSVDVGGAVHTFTPIQFTTSHTGRYVRVDGYFSHGLTQALARSARAVSSRYTVRVGYQSERKFVERRVGHTSATSSLNLEIEIKL